VHAGDVPPQFPRRKSEKPRREVKRMRTSTSAFVPSALNTLAPAHMSHPMARCSRQPVIAMRCSADDGEQPVSIDGRRPLSLPQQSSRRGALKGIITAAILAMGEFISMPYAALPNPMARIRSEDDCSLFLHSPRRSL
jgi:hypothetical protein